MNVIYGARDEGKQSQKHAKVERKDLSGVRAVVSVVQVVADAPFDRSHLWAACTLRLRAVLVEKTLSP